MSIAPKPGDQLPVMRVAAVDREAVLNYVTCAGDDNPIHTDEDAAHAAGLSGLVLPGMLIAAQFPRLLQLWGEPVRLVDFSVQFLAPLAIDRPFVVTGKVVARAHGGQTVIRMTAQDGRSVVAMAEARVAPL